MIIDNDRTGNSSIGLAAGIRLNTIEPGGILADVVLGREVDVCAAKVVESVEIVQGQRVGSSGNGGEIHLRLGVSELRANV